ncbi:MAG: hypothetical protein L0Z62_06470 [Gemmataceae bacterium]|nr:hypothetical protein [Gemmataceae bacterium]
MESPFAASARKGTRRSRSAIGFPRPQARPQVEELEQRNLLAIFFGAFDGTTQNFYRSEGRIETTSVLGNLDLGTPNDIEADEGAHLAFLNNTLFFGATAPGGGRELWMSDGTKDGTKVVPGGASDPRELTPSGGALWFTADDGAGGRALWRLNLSGTSAAKVSGLSNVTELTDVNGTLFFSATDGKAGVELWKVPEGGTPTLIDIVGGCWRL